MVIKSLASQRVFNNRFSNSMKKAKLIYESTYAREKKKEENVYLSDRRTSGVISRLAVSCAISYPSPLKLFPEIPALSNYDVVVVSRDP